VTRLPDRVDIDTRAVLRLLDRRPELADMPWAGVVYAQALRAA
jgi:hypothetical protein